jgi:hypothetical protein
MDPMVACEPFITVADIACDCDTEPVEELEALIAEASDIIAILTGGMITGRCTETVRPVGRDRTCWDASGGITLRGPDPEITAVTIDGAAFTDYEILDDRILVRTDGQQWPTNQKPWQPDTDDGTFSVTYTYGNLPHLAKRAAADIVCDLLRSKPNDTRRLAPNARAATVSGVSIQLEQTAMEIKRRALMIPNLVRLLTVYAPDAGSPAVVYSPELEDGWTLHRVTTGP